MNQDPAPQPPATPSPVGPTPQPTYAAPGQPTTYSPPPAQNPGQTMGIIGLVLAFVGLAPIGLVLSIISLVQSGKAQASKTLGIIGTILNSLEIIAGVILILLFTGLLAIASLEPADDARLRLITYAIEIDDKAKAYKEQEGDYPLAISDFAKYPQSRLTNTEYTVVDKDPTGTHMLKYQRCSKTGAQVTYSDPEFGNKLMVHKIGDAGSGLNCTKGLY